MVNCWSVGGVMLQFHRPVELPVLGVGRYQEAPDAIVHLLFLVGAVEVGDGLAALGSKVIPMRWHGGIMVVAGSGPAEITNGACRACGKAHGGEQDGRPGEQPGRDTRPACASAAKDRIDWSAMAASRVHNAPR